MDIRFFDDPLEQPRPREDVRIRQIGLFLYPESAAGMFGIELTPFRERPSIEVHHQRRGRPGRLAARHRDADPRLQPDIHLRDRSDANPYELTAVLYYAWPDRDRQEVERRTVTFDMDERRRTPL
jgi:hypothetical protein